MGSKIKKGDKVKIIDCPEQDNGNLWKSVQRQYIGQIGTIMDYDLDIPDIKFDDGYTDCFHHSKWVKVEEQGNGFEEAIIEYKGKEKLHMIIIGTPPQDTGLYCSCSRPTITTGTTAMFGTGGITFKHCTTCRKEYRL